MLGWILRKNRGYPPDDAVALGNQTDGAGVLYSAVANTQWGTIPGKAKGKTCWYSYKGKEIYTNDFSWVCAKLGTVDLVKSSGLGPSPQALKVGHQTDGAGDLYAAVAISDHGTIPGKAKDKTCWYPYGGKETYTNKFYWVTVNPDNTATCIFKPNHGSPPDDAMMLGYQNDGAGDLFLAVANTKWGTIPGKAKDGTCWYPYGGKEYYTSDFSWPCAAFEMYTLYENDGYGPPVYGLKVGFQGDGTGDLYAAVAITDHGQIPGKAKDNTCWYSYGGKEHYTSKFYWVVLYYRGTATRLLARAAAPPPPPKSIQMNRNTRTTDEISFTRPTQGRGITNVASLPGNRLWCDCVTLIGRIGFDETERHTQRTLGTQHSVRLDYQGSFTRGNTSYANLQLQIGGNTVANAVIETGVNFGQREIRRALTESLQHQCVATLIRRHHSPRHDEL